MIEAKIIKDTKHYKTGTRLTTFEIVFHRYALSEVNTHKMLSKNSASSRAIPIKSNIEYIKNNTAYPVSWGKNQPGMVAEEDLPQDIQEQAKKIWEQARDDAIKHASALADLGVHKQLANRLIENFSYQKVIISGTEWDNFFWLRNDKDAQPEFRELASKMLDEYNKSNPETLFVGEWHLPYVTTKRIDGVLKYYDNQDIEIDLESAKKISASCCAQVSYRKADDSMEKALNIFDKLNIGNIENGKPHVSPTEHSGTPMDFDSEESELPIGVTHMKLTDGSMWSANFKDFIQYRKTIPNECCENYSEIKEK